MHIGSLLAGLVIGFVAAIVTLSICLINRPIDFDNLFPKTIYANTNTVKEQIKHIKSEMLEVTKAFFSEDMNHTDEEVMDLMHSCKTYFDIRKGQGIDTNSVRQLVIQKNKNRRYYLGH